MPPAPRTRQKKQADTSPLERAEMEVKVARRMLAARKAKDSLIEFVRLMMPDPADPDDASLSRYKVAKHHRALAAALEEVEAGRLPRLIITIPPRHGKSQLSSKAFPAWFLGRDPYRQTIVASYAAAMAEDFGRAVREYMQTPAYAQIFTDTKLKKGGASADRIETDEGGIGVFVGIGGALTGRGADLLLIDDPIKDREEADSATIRDKIWNWFTDVAMTRLMDGMGRVVIIMTRWHEDDLVGRLTNPNNPCFNAEEAEQWKIIDFPALAKDNDILGRAKDEPLWPERITKKFLTSMRRLNARGFAALYQGDPRPEEGDFFKTEWIRTYKPDELPSNLRKYCSSDHAVSTKQDRDPTVLIPAGVDEEGTIWILPDVWWRRAQSDTVVEAMVELMRRHKPLVWWAENGHISKSIGPFLRKIMQEEEVFCAIDEITPVKDKQTRAQSIQGRMAMGRVRFPAFAPWWEAALQQMLTFPAAKHDDFVDALAYIGLGLGRVTAANKPKEKKKGPEVGSIAWVKASAKLRAAKERLKKDIAGF